MPRRCQEQFLSVTDAYTGIHHRWLLKDEKKFPGPGMGRKKVFQIERGVWRPTWLQAVPVSGAGTDRRGEKVRGQTGCDHDHRLRDSGTPFPWQEERNLGCVERWVYFRVGRDRKYINRARSGGKNMMSSNSLRRNSGGTGSMKNMYRTLGISILQILID